jgi:acetyl esterase/lipase
MAWAVGVGITEWVTPFQTKLQHVVSRREASRRAEHGAPSFAWGYISPGQDLRDPSLSPIFTEHHMLPKWLFFIGAEYDMLCREEQEIIMDLAGWMGRVGKMGSMVLRLENIDGGW